jgi:hypothetical protein
LNEFLHLLRDTYVSLEDYQAPRLGLAEKSALGGVQRKPRHPGDESARRHRRGLPRARRKGQACGA